MQKNILNSIYAFFIALVSSFVIGAFTIFILMLIIPSRDEQGHGAMPIFQFAMGWIVGIVAFFVIFILAFRKIKQKNITLKIGNKTIVLLYFIVSLLFVFGVIISFYEYSFSGYYSDKILGWVWLMFTVFIIIKFWKIKSTKMYFFSLLGIVFLSLLPMAIPFTGMVYYFSIIGDYQQLTIDEKYRLERTKPNAMARGPIIIIYEKRGLLEKMIASSQCITCMDMYVYDSPEEINDPINDVQLVEITKDSITIEPTIKNKEIRLTFPIIK